MQKEAEDDEPGENTTKLQDIILLVHYCDANEDLEAIKRAVLMDMGAIWTEAASDYGVNGEKMLEKSFNVRVVPLAHPIYQVSQSSLFHRCVCVCMCALITMHNLTDGRV